MTFTTALVTGAGSGIGHATAHALRNAGLTVYATARRPEVVEQLRAEGFEAVVLDVTDELEARRVVSTIEDLHGAVGVLVNNAGYGQLGAIEDVSIDRWRAQFETNVFGLIRMTQLVLPAMRRQRAGRIINLGSMGGMFTFPLGGAYHATKYALEAVTDALRFEVAPFGIDVVLVQPAAVDTPLAERTVASIGDPGPSAYRDMLEAFHRTSRSSASSGTMLAADDVAHVVAHAATTPEPDTRYLIGELGRQLVDARRTLGDRGFDSMLGTVRSLV